jgi:hypothetical protein
MESTRAPHLKLNPTTSDYQNNRGHAGQAWSLGSKKGSGKEAANKYKNDSVPQVKKV